ncbi:hypothetical protein TRAPUB_9634 [Trametes pubescens]|uniref:F-box domain-containing protein n=1 Tax=Trametes pubescens TaxID=154538 RepID=A0A1M2W1P8_TRAPU|nr:hypothetical protein TRAPUB_9634 [Trametes pubescens]
MHSSPGPSPPPMPPGQNGDDMCIDIIEPYLIHIKDLTLSDNMPRTEMPGKIDICVLTHLRCVRIFTPVFATLPAIQLLMGFPDLRELLLNFEFSADTQAALAGTGLAPGFFELHELNLSASFEDIAIFLDATEPVGLESLTLARSGQFHRHQGGAQIVQDIHAAYAKIPRHVRGLHLHLTGDHHYFDGDERSLPELAASQILPEALRTLPDIEELTVTYSSLGASVTDDELVTFSTVWPALTRFEFNSTLWKHRHGSNEHHFRDYNALLKLSTLLAFTSAHPHLIQLSLPALGPEGIPQLDIRLHVPFRAHETSSHGMRLLRLNTVAPETPVVALAIALDCVFRRLELGHPGTVTVDNMNMKAGYLWNGPPPELSLTGEDVLMTLLLALQTAWNMGGMV